MAIRHHTDEQQRCYRDISPAAFTCCAGRPPHVQCVQFTALCPETDATPATHRNVCKCRVARRCYSFPASSARAAFLSSKSSKVPCAKAVKPFELRRPIHGSGCCKECNTRGNRGCVQARGAPVSSRQGSPAWKRIAGACTRTHHPTQPGARGAIGSSFGSRV